MFPQRRLLLNRIPQSLVASSRSILVHVLVDSSIDLQSFQFSPVKHCLPLSRDSVHAKVLNPRCLTEYFTQNLMDLACFCSKSQDKTTKDEKPGTLPARWGCKLFLALWTTKLHTTWVLDNHLDPFGWKVTSDLGDGSRSGRP